MLASRLFRFIGKGGALLVVLCLAAPPDGAPAQARELRLALERDTSSLDSMRNWDALTLAITTNIYDPLIDFEPDRGFHSRLAESWEQVAPDRWRFRLREGVRFQGGEPLTADDVVFSVERMRHRNSRGANVLRNLASVEAVDARTVDLVARTPDPVLINQLNTLVIMSRGWAERNGATEPSSVGQAETSHAVNHANGTGPFSVVSWEPGIRLVLARNPAWFGWGQWPGNVERVVMTPISSAATRISGLLSGELDMVSPVSMQDAERIRSDASTRLIAGHEARVVYLGMDVAREELLHATVTPPGRNPFRDLRVRQAVAHAVNMEGLNRVVFRGFAAPAAMIVPEGVSGFDPSVLRPAFDLNRARALMREAGYPDGFRVTLDCPAGREVGDRDACEALVNLLARINIRVDLLAQPPARWLPKVTGRDTSLYYMSWGNNGWAGGNMLHDLLSCAEARRQGGFNSGGYCNPVLDEAVQSARTEVDPARHLSSLREAFQLVQRDMPVVPLYAPPILWGTRAGITVKLRPDGRVFLPYVVMP